MIKILYLILSVGLILLITATIRIFFKLDSDGTAWFIVKAVNIGLMVGLIMFFFRRY
jgi:hypothetical protein